MDFNKFNLIGKDYWTQDSVRNWVGCDLLDRMHEMGGIGYTAGRSKENPLGPKPHPDYL